MGALVLDAKAACRQCMNGRQVGRSPATWLSFPANFCKVCVGITLCISASLIRVATFSSISGLTATSMRSVPNVNTAPIQLTLVPNAALCYESLRPMHLKASMKMAMSSSS
eukprot:4990037-Amphidinium_carterae.1